MLNNGLFSIYLPKVAVNHTLYLAVFRAQQQVCEPVLAPFA